MMFLWRLRNELSHTEYQLRCICNRRKMMNIEDPEQDMKDEIAGEEYICQLSDMIAKYVEEQGLHPANRG